jgi:RNA polymerase sigma factor (sigma-70 family)
MAGRSTHTTLLRDVRTIFEFGVARDVCDLELLDRFLFADRAAAEAAFTFLVERHGPMVLSVCRQFIDDPDDVEDAFQATFLVFLRRAKSIRKRDSLASWLFGVATHVARRARSAATVRRFHEREAGELALADAKTRNNTYSDTLAALHEEVARLPDRYREPIVLCHLEGLSTAAAAIRLGCAHGTILSRLARARGRLRRSLARRGRSELACPVARGWLSVQHAAPLPAGLVHSTVQAAVHVTSVRAASAAIRAPSVVAMAQATLRTLFMTRITVGSALLATAGVCTAMMVSSVMSPAGAGSSATAAVTSATQNPAEKPRPDEENKGLRPQEIKEALYRILKRDHAFRDPRWSFIITVRDVVEDALIDPTFRHRTKGDNREFDLVIQSKRAILHVDLTGKALYAILEEPEVQGYAPIDGRDVMLLEQVLKIPVPPGDPFSVDGSVPAEATLSPEQQLVLAAQCLRRVKETHGTENVWAVAGYRIGARALRELGLPRHADSLLVIHRCPQESPYTVMADGLQAATGATAGKRNLRLEEAARENRHTLIEDKNTGRRLAFTLKIEFVKSFLGAPLEFLVTEAERVASLPDDAIFDVRTD